MSIAESSTIGNFCEFAHGFGRANMIDRLSRDDMEAAKKLLPNIAELLCPTEKNYNDLKPAYQIGLQQRHVIVAQHPKRWLAGGK